ncbi:unnamed protein product [Colias eurytheme]|nr:unnamed protein product [Colias eurytheme]
MQRCASCRRVATISAVSAGAPVWVRCRHAARPPHAHTRAANQLIARGRCQTALSFRPLPDEPTLLRRRDFIRFYFPLRFFSIAFNIREEIPAIHAGYVHATPGYFNVFIYKVPEIKQNAPRMEHERYRSLVASRSLLHAPAG